MCPNFRNEWYNFLKENTKYSLKQEYDLFVKIIAKFN